MARVALVTGGIRGIGAAIARALQSAGCRVAVTFAGNAEAAQAFQAETGIPPFQWDAGDFAACIGGVRQVEAAIGPIDILVNNAGIARDSALHKMTREQWDAVISTNLDGLFNMCRAVIEGMRSRKFGRIIGAEPRATIALSAKLLDDRGQLQAARIFRRDAPIETLAAGPAARAFNKAFDALARDLISWTVALDGT